MDAPGVLLCLNSYRNRKKFNFTLSICSFLIGLTVVFIMQLLTGEQLYKIFFTSDVLHGVAIPHVEDVGARET